MQTSYIRAPFDHLRLVAVKGAPITSSHPSTLEINLTTPGKILPAEGQTIEIETVCSGSITNIVYGEVVDLYSYKDTIYDMAHITVKKISITRPNADLAQNAADPLPKPPPPITYLNSPPPGKLPDSPSIGSILTQNDAFAPTSAPDQEEKFDEDDLDLSQELT